MLSNAGLERAVIAGLCQHSSDVYFDVADFLSSATFENDTNSFLYACIKDIYEDNNNAKIEPTLIYSAACKLGQPEFFTDKHQKDYLKALFQTKILAENVSKFAGKLRKLEIARLLYDLSENAKKVLMNVTGDETIDSIISLVESPLMEFSSLLNSGSRDGTILLSDEIDAYVEYLENNPRDIIGLSTGMPIFDKAIGGGLRRGAVSLIGARAKIGKTSCGINVAIHVAKNLKIPVLFLDTEMSKKDMMTLCLSNLGNVDRIETEMGKFTLNTLQKASIHKAREIIKQIPFYYHSIAGVPFEETVAFMRRWVLKKVGYNDEGKLNDCLIIYDYVKLMTSDNITQNLQEYQALGFIMTGLHNFSVRYDLPILGFTQLNRDGIDKESTDVISGSDRLLWLCSNFSVYKVKSDEEIAEDGPENGNRKLLVLACRHGAGLPSGDYINILMDGSVCRITEGKNKFNTAKKRNPGFEIQDGPEDSDIPFKD